MRALDLADSIPRRLNRPILVAARARRPALGLGVLTGLALLLAGCASGPLSERESTPPTAQAAAGNRWSSQLEHKREALVRAGANSGTQVARTADNQLKLILPGDAFFDAGRADLKPAMRPVLDEIARQLDPTVRLTVVGHTDGAGPASVNDPLSMDRAEAVREYLVNHGVQRGRLLVEGRGGREPVASNATESGRAANRRVEIYLSQPAS